MKPIRPFFHALLGLLLVPGAALAATRVAATHECATSPESVLPCGDDCRDASTCPIAAQAVESALSFAFSVAQDVLDSSASPSPVSLAPSSPLRPSASNPG